MKEFPLIRSVPAAVIAVAVSVLPAAVLSLNPLTALYALLFILFLLPVAAGISASCAGLLPAGLSVICGILCAGKIAGPQGLAMAGLYLGGVSAAYLLIHLKKPEFFKSCLIMILTHMAALTLCYVWAQRMFDNQLYLTAGRAAADYIKSLPQCDNLLTSLYSAGFIALPKELSGQFLAFNNGIVAMTDTVRQDMLLSVTKLVSDLVTSLVPAVLLQQSILSGVGCLLLSQRFGKIYCDKLTFKAPEGAPPAPFADLKMPPFSLWHLPRGLGWKVGLAWVAGTLLTGAQNQTLMMAGQVLYYAANGILTVQGAALLNFTQKAKGTRRLFRVLMPCLFMALGILPYLGIFDQIINLRGLRKPPEPKEEL